MIVLVVSDSHGKVDNLIRAVELTHPDYVLHLGDVQRDLEALRRAYPMVPMEGVPGNCDYGSEAPLTQTIDLMPGHRVFATHGHRYRVNSTLDYLEQAALEEGCDIALYGHTHASQCTYENGIYVMNPGSASCPRDGNPPSYGILDVSSAGVMTNVVFLETKTRF